MPHRGQTVKRSSPGRRAKRFDRTISFPVGHSSVEILPKSALQISEKRLLGHWDPLARSINPWRLCAT